MHGQTASNRTFYIVDVISVKDEEDEQHQPSQSSDEKKKIPDPDCEDVSEVDVRLIIE